MTPEPDAGAGFNPRYSFDQFIIGDGNRLAHAAALAVAELPGQAYNPLFLHAPPGLGKTHLLHAIGNYVLAYGGGAGSATRPSRHSPTTSSPHSAPARSTASSSAYRDVDVLLIDDVQFLASKAKTEEEFFHTFNALYENGRQLVLTCDRLPRSSRASRSVCASASKPASSPTSPHPTSPRAWPSCASGPHSTAYRSPTDGCSS